MHFQEKFAKLQKISYNFAKNQVKSMVIYIFTVVLVITVIDVRNLELKNINMNSMTDHFRKHV